MDSRNSSNLTPRFMLQDEQFIAKPAAGSKHTVDTSNLDLHQTAALNTAFDIVDRIRKLIEKQDLKTCEYLTDLFWKHYNSCVCLIHKKIFIADSQRGFGDCYSPIQHLAVLATGLRFADTRRQDIQTLMVHGKRSLLHQELKECLETGQHTNQGVPHIQSLLLLADLEYCYGAEGMARIYIDAAFNKTLEMESEVLRTHLMLSDDDFIARRILLRACHFIKRYWLLFQGPISGTTGSEYPVHIIQKWTTPGNTSSSVLDGDLESQIYFAHLKLMDIAGEVVRLNLQRKDSTQQFLVELSEYESRVRGWYRDLQWPIKWTKHNSQTAPPSFFLLHQQFRAVMIHLNRPFSSSRLAKPANGRINAKINECSARCSRTCTNSAIEIATMVSIYHKRFKFKTAFSFVIHQVALAASVLVVELSSIHDQEQRLQTIRHLQSLENALEDMQETYTSVAKILSVLRMHLRNSSVHSNETQDPVSTNGPEDTIMLGLSPLQDPYEAFIHVGNQDRGNNSSPGDYLESAQGQIQNNNDNDHGAIAGIGNFGGSVFPSCEQDLWLEGLWDSNYINQLTTDQTDSEIPLFDLGTSADERTPDGLPPVVTGDGLLLVTESTKDKEDEMYEDSWVEMFGVLGGVAKKRELGASNPDDFGDIVGFMFNRT